MPSSVLRNVFGIALSVSLVATSLPAGVSGSYLAARQASFNTDFQAAARYFERAYAHDRGNARLMESISAAHIALGDFEKAAVFATQLVEEGLRSQVAHMARLASAAGDGQFGDVIARMDEGETVGPLVDGLVRGWAELGRGDIVAAQAAFDEVGAQRGLRGLADYHAALALASIGDFAQAASLLEGETGAAQATRRGVIAHAQILNQLGRSEDAVVLIDEMFTTRLDPALSALRENLVAGTSVPFDIITSPQDGIAEVFFTVAGALQGEASDDYTLLYTRVAEHLRPDHVDALLLSARLLEGVQEYELATETYARVPLDHPAYHAAAMGRADALRESGDVDAAIEALRQLTRSHGHLPIVHTTLGDILRQNKRFEEAVNAYNTSIDIYGEPALQGQWFVYFARGIAHERTDDWPAAEADFRKALELNPDQPQVLNYLGYSLVEKKIKLDEALDMIQRAVAARPNSGYIVDSLGWVLFRLGRYEEAVPHMERAAELMPIDPVVNDHLGDVYWAVGRKLEARFQWQRSLSFVEFDEHGEADPDRVRLKLEIGLDAVLEREGLPPLQMANNEN